MATRVAAGSLTAEQQAAVTGRDASIVLSSLSKEDKPDPETSNLLCCLPQP